MATGSSYLGYVRDVLGSVTRYWEAREDGDGFNKSWEVHEETAEELACTAAKLACSPDDVPSLTRQYFLEMAGSVRADMAAKGLPCEAVRKLVSNRALEEDRGATDPVRVHARNAAASLLVEAGDEWMPGDSGTTFAGVRIGGPLIWSRIVPMAQAEARTAVARRMKQGDVPALFGSFFWRFMRAVRTQRRAERRPWGEIRTRLVTELFLPTRLPEDPFRAAAYATAALLLETIPFEASSNNATLQRASPRVLCSPRRALVSPAQATAAEAEEPMAERKPSPPSAVEIDTTARYAVKSPPPATADVVHNPPLRTPPALGMPTTPTAPTLGTKPAMKSVTKGYGPNLLDASQQLENKASPDHAGCSSPSSMSEGQHAYTANATAASAAMVTPAGTGKGVGARAGLLPPQPAPETVEHDEVDWELVHEKLGLACPEPQDLYQRQAGGGGVDAPSSSPQNLRTTEPGTSDVYAMAVAAAEAAAASAAAADRAAQAAEAAEAAAAVAAAEDPIPAVAGAGGDGSGDATAAGTFNHSYASAGGGRFCGDASDPADGDCGGRAGEKRKAANAEGDDEESQCDGGQRKKTRSG